MEPAENLESTAGLLQRVRGGDARARERLLARYLPALRRWAHGRLPARARELADTDDLVQVTLIRALDHLGDFEPQRPGSFLAWLRRILLNALRDEIRRTVRRPRREPLDDALPDPGPSVVERAIGSESLERYETALSGLSDDQQEAVILRIEMGLTHEQVAEAMGKPSANAARMVVVRALARLAEAMDEHRT